MTISERIFDRLKSVHMSQKDFAEKTGILPSTISEWKRKKTNPSSDKILIICNTLGVSPEWLLSGVDPAGGRQDRRDTYIIDHDSELGELVRSYNALDSATRIRLMGYLDALGEVARGSEAD